MVEQRRLFGGRHVVAGAIVFGLGALACVTNGYLSLVRPRVERARHPSASPRPVSGFPLVGALVLPGLFLLPASSGISLVTAMLLVIDTGGASWFVVATWRDESFWT